MNWRSGCCVNRVYTIIPIKHDNVKHRRILIGYGGVFAQVV